MGDDEYLPTWGGAIVEEFSLHKVSIAYKTHLLTHTHTHTHTHTYIHTEFMPPAVQTTLILNYKDYKTDINI